MNAAFYIIAIPAFITSFLYLSLGWGFRVSVPVTAHRDGSGNWWPDLHAPPQIRHTPLTGFPRRHFSLKSSST